MATRFAFMTVLASNVEDAAPDVPDYPPCDVCGKEFEGKLRCSKCQCAFYCGHECQKADWKKNHKKDCATMAQSCKDAASAFVNAVTLFVDLSIDLKDTDAIIPSVASSAVKNVLDYDLWHAMDNAGAYKYAIVIDINGAIESMLEEDIQNAGIRYELKIPMSFTEMVMTILFRGGRNIPGRVFSGIDAYRIKKYIRSSPTAFETWLQSSFHIMHIFQTHAVKAARKNEFTFLKLQSAARNIASAWVQVFTSPTASKAILLGSSKVVDEAATDRVKWMIQQISKIMYQFPEDSPIKGEFYTFIALIELRVQEFGIDVGNFEKVLGLKGDSFKLSYYDVAVPIAVAIIAKGKRLTNLEIHEAVRKHAQSVRSRRTRTSHGVGGGTGGDSNIRGGSKKKGKQGRRN